MTAIFILSIAALGAMWRRWLGMDDTSIDPRGLKIAIGSLIVFGTMIPFGALQQPLLAVAATTLAMIMWVLGHGEGLDMGSVGGTWTGDLIYMIKRYSMNCVPVTAFIIYMGGSPWLLAAAVLIGALAGASYGICHKLGIKNYTEAAEFVVGSMVVAGPIIMGVLL